jgi:glycosyltransferase involved in cell wall biosynthesis
MELINKLTHVKVKEYENSCADLPLVSICIVTYQHVDFITQCLDGVLMQKTNFSYEIILGEDESSDGTREICIEYAKKHPDKIRLFLHSRENNIKINNTPTGRFNFLYGLSQARGKYIALCEGDDYWIDSEKLQKQVDFLEKNRDYSLCFHNAYIFDNITKKTIAFCKESQKKTTSTPDLIQKWYIPTASMIFRAKPELPYWYTSVPNGDYAMQFILAREGKIGYINRIMSVYRLTHKGISSSDQKSRLIHLIRLFKLLEEYYNYKYYWRFKKKLMKLRINRIKVELLYAYRKLKKTNNF